MLFGKLLSARLTQNEQDIEQWMLAVAEKRSTGKKKMVYDKPTKTMVAVDENDPRANADNTIPFDPQEAKRYL